MSRLALVLAVQAAASNAAAATDALYAANRRLQDYDGPDADRTDALTCAALDRHAMDAAASAKSALMAAGDFAAPHPDDSDIGTVLDAARLLVSLGDADKAMDVLRRYLNGEPDVLQTLALRR